MASKNEQIRRHKGRNPTGRFFAIPHKVLKHPAFTTASPRAVKLLIDLGVQFNGKNNGDLCAAMKLMRERGWKSGDSLHRARQELVERGLILQTRQGGKHKASLYALSWLPVDECKGKLDVRPTTSPPDTWKQIKNGAPYSDQSAPYSDQSKEGGAR